MKIPHHKDEDSMYVCRKGVRVRRNSAVRYQKIETVRKNSSMEITLLGKSSGLFHPVLYLMWNAHGGG